MPIYLYVRSLSLPHLCFDFVLYYTILYYTILYYTILYYTILYYTILYYTILYYTILYYYYTTHHNLTNPIPLCLGPIPYNVASKTISPNKINKYSLTNTSTFLLRQTIFISLLTQD